MPHVPNPRRSSPHCGSRSTRSGIQSGVAQPTRSKSSKVASQAKLRECGSEKEIDHCLFHARGGGWARDLRHTHSPPPPTTSREGSSYVATVFQVFSLRRLAASTRSQNNSLDQAPTEIIMWPRAATKSFPFSEGTCESPCHISRTPRAIVPAARFRSARRSGIRSGVAPTCP